MAWLGKFFKLLRIRKIAIAIADGSGRKVANGMLFDDNKIRISIGYEMVNIYYYNKKTEQKLCYSYDKAKNSFIYHPGSWEAYLVKQYKTLKTRE